MPNNIINTTLYILHNAYRSHAPFNTKLTCLYTNADSFMNKRTELDARITHSQPMIIAIIEMKPKHSRYSIEKNKLNLQGYDLFTNVEGNGRGV